MNQHLLVKMPELNDAELIRGSFGGNITAVSEVFNEKPVSIFLVRI